MIHLYPVISVHTLDRHVAVTNDITELHVMMFKEMRKRGPRLV